MRSGLHHDDKIVFTHSDLHRSNILVSKLDNEVPRNVAIIDWHQSGWYPAAWEFFKCRFTTKGKERWEDDYIFEFLHSYRGNVLGIFCAVRWNMSQPFFTANDEPAQERVCRYRFII